MADTTTTNYSLIMPGINDPAGTGTWGGKLNSNMQAIDSALATLAGQVSGIGGGGGIKGDKGDPGKDGAQGPQGNPGKDGAAGKNGAPGATGPAGTFPNPYVGNVGIAGNVVASGHLISGAATTADSPTFAMADTTGAVRGYMQYVLTGAAAPQMAIVSTGIGGASGSIAIQKDGTFFVSSSVAYKPGGGSWTAASDERIKNVLGDYDLGLDAVIQLRPVVYRYKGNDGEHKEADGPFVGLIAQEVEDIMPDMVSMKEGEIDGQKVDDLRVLDTSELIFALVNACRQLKRELDELRSHVDGV